MYAPMAMGPVGEDERKTASGLGGPGLSLASVEGEEAPGTGGRVRDRFADGDGARSVRRAIRLNREGRSLLATDGPGAAAPFSNYSESLLRPAADACREHLPLMSEARRYLKKAADLHPP